MLNDALIASNDQQLYIPLVPFVRTWNNLFTLNDTFMEEIQVAVDSTDCNYTTYMNENLVYPAHQDGPQGTYGDCSFVGGSILDAVQLKNPCFDLFQITNYCPLLWDVVPPPLYPGYPQYKSSGNEAYYFNRTAVQKAINAPDMNWVECTTGNVFVNGSVDSPVPYLDVYPRVIEKSVRTILAHGSLGQSSILLYLVRGCRNDSNLFNRHGTHCQWHSYDNPGNVM
jgi:carboxypeptidase D